MRVRSITAAVLFATCIMAAKAGSIVSFEDAKEIWRSSKDRVQYEPFAREFIKRQSFVRPDVLKGCYALGEEPLELMLVVVRRDDGSGVVAEVFADQASAKSECYIKSYRGFPLVAPPFLPFVLRMGIEPRGAGA